jgi:hypothetical protein
MWAQWDAEIYFKVAIKKENKLHIQSGYIIGTYFFKLYLFLCYICNFACKFNIWKSGAKLQKALHSLQKVLRAFKKAARTLTNIKNSLLACFSSFLLSSAKAELSTSQFYKGRNKPRLEFSRLHRVNVWRETTAQTDTV